MDVIRDDKALFCDGELYNALHAQKERIKDAVNRVPSNELLRTPLEQLAEEVAEQYSVRPLALDRERTVADPREHHIRADRLRDWEFRISAGRRGQPQSIPGHLITYHVPFSGDPRLFGLQPNTHTFNPPRGTISGNELVLSFQCTTVGPHIKQAFEQEMQEVEKHIGWQRSTIESHNAEVRALAMRLLSERVQRLRQAADAADSLGVPLRRRPDAPMTYAAPEVRRKIPAATRIASRTGNVTPRAPEPTLPDVEYEHILKVMRGMALVLERSPSAFEHLGEEGIRWHFLVQLNGQYEGQATGETFNYTGKTDILVRSGDRIVFIAECKFWSGPQGFSDTIDQLLGYLTWRETKAAIVIFNRKTQLSTVLGKIPETLKAHRSCMSAVKQIEGLRDLGWVA